VSTFTLPDLGEGLPDAEIVEWHVKEGDHVELDAPLVSMETAKAVVEVPAPQAGIVEKLHGKPGDVIQTGAPLVQFASAVSEPVAQSSTTVAGKIEEGDTVIEDVSFSAQATEGATVLAAPAVRARARQMHIDLTKVKGSGPKGAVLMTDLPSSSVSNPVSAVSQNPPEGFEPLRGPRRSMAHAMISSKAQVVPVSIYDTVDVSAWIEKGDITVRIIEAIVEGVKAEPGLNAWFDTASESVKVHKALHLGMAVDSPEGLFVPVLKDIQDKDRQALRETINQFKKAAQEKSFTPDALKGATLTLSNFGKFAGQFASPIVVPPAVAILGVGRLTQTPVVKNNTVTIGHLLPLSLTFDHRGVTGGEATRFLKTLMDSLSKP
tara:strand:+ start:205 stop:1338 length:1134 start_codon:yes stop_codon:yes gene_type:complete